MAGQVPAGFMHDLREIEVNLWPCCVVGTCFGSGFTGKLKAHRRDLPVGLHFS